MFISLRIHSLQIQIFHLIFTTKGPARITLCLNTCLEVLDSKRSKGKILFAWDKNFQIHFTSPIKEKEQSNRMYSEYQIPIPDYVKQAKSMIKYFANKVQTRTYTEIAPLMWGWGS